MKKLLAITALFFAFTSCQKKDNTPKNQIDESNVTTDVLAKVSSHIEYRTRESSLTISKNGDYKLRYDGLVQQYQPSTKTLEHNEARCLVDLEGKMTFFKSKGVRPGGSLMTTARMSMTFARVAKSSATPHTKEGTDVNELCRGFANAAFDQGAFTNSIVSYDGIIVLFAGVYFDVKNNDKKTNEDTPYLYRAQITTGEMDDYDVIRHSYMNTYFVSNGGEYDITMMAFNDLQGEFKEVKADAATAELKPMEVTVGMYKDLRTLKLTQSDCKIDYEYFIMNVLVTTKGVRVKLLTPMTTEFDNSLPACVELNEKLKALGAVNGIAWANQTKNENEPNNFLKLYIKQPDESVLKLSFISKSKN